MESAEVQVTLRLAQRDIRLLRRVRDEDYVASGQMEPGELEAAEKLHRAGYLRAVQGRGPEWSRMYILTGLGIVAVSDAPLS